MTSRLHWHAVKFKQNTTTASVLLHWGVINATTDGSRICWRRML